MPICSLRRERRFAIPCFSNSHSPAPARLQPRANDNQVQFVGSNSPLVVNRQTGPSPAQRRMIGDRQEAWCLAPNNVEATAREIMNYYAKRWAIDIDQAWRLSRLCGGGGGAVGGPRRQAAPGRRRGADRLQCRDRLGVGAHQDGTFRTAVDVAAR